MGKGMKKILPFMTPEAHESIANDVDKFINKSQSSGLVPCCECGKPTKSHRINNKTYCHHCCPEECLKGK